MPGDGGAAAERTALAWQRTGLAAMGVGALLVRLHPVTPWPGALLVAAGTLLAGVVAPMRHARILRAVRAGSTPLAQRTVTGLVVVVLLVLVGSAATLAVR